MGDIEDTTDARRTVHQHCMNGLMRLVRFAKFGNATVIKRHSKSANVFLFVRLYIGKEAS